MRAGRDFKGRRNKHRINDTDNYPSMLTGNFDVYESVSAAVFQQALLDFPFTAGGSDWNDVKQGERRCLRLAYGKPDKIAPLDGIISSK